ncbi:unnamed protein product, partial [Mesorhabditis spiculigera]
MDVSRQRARIESQLAALPGCTDRLGSPLILISPHAHASTAVTANKAASTSCLVASSGLYDDLVAVLGYFSQIPPPEALSEKGGLCVLIDGRKTPSRAVRTVLRACQQALYRKVRLAIILQPERFLDQQKINLDLLVETHQFKTILTSVHKLSRWVDVTQLPASFGGPFPYEPLRWCDMREHFEFAEAALRARLAELEAGGKPLEDDELAVVARRPEVEAEAQKKEEEEQEKKRLLEEHAQGVNSLLDWLEGPGEKWVQSLHEIGESRDEARQLVREHEQLSTKSQEVCQQAEELGELAQRLTATAPEHAITLQKIRDILLATSQIFAGRVKRQAEMAGRSEKFHEQMSEFSRKTDSLLESLCTDPHCTDLAGAEAERKQLEEKVEQMEGIYESVMDMGAVFAEDLATPDKNTKIGPRNYAAGVHHVRESMAAARHRRKRCLDLVDVRRLKLEQIIRLSTCERDANQAIAWVEELHDTLRRDYNQVGCDEEELRVLKKDREQLEDTARSTYNYGKELCQVALVLRRSLRMDAIPQKQLADKLEHTWGRLCRALTEHDSRTHICGAFNSACIQVGPTAQN